MAEHNILGRSGEKIAQQYLLENEYKILDCNWRFEKKEIDIIAQKDNLIIFVEVKTRKNDFYGSPEESVNENKQRFLVEAAEAYLVSENINCESRFDIISIIFHSGQSYKIYHIESAFIP